MSLKVHLLRRGPSFPSTLCGREPTSLLDTYDATEFLAVPVDSRCAQCASLAWKGGGDERREKGARTGPEHAGQAPVRTAGVGTEAGVPARGGGVSQPVC